MTLARRLYCFMTRVGDNISSAQRTKRKEVEIKIWALSCDTSQDTKWTHLFSKDQNYSLSFTVQCTYNVSDSQIYRHKNLRWVDMPLKSINHSSWHLPQHQAVYSGFTLKKISNYIFFIKCEPKIDHFITFCSQEEVNYKKVIPNYFLWFGRQLVIWKVCKISVNCSQVSSIESRSVWIFWLFCTNRKHFLRFGLFRRDSAGLLLWSDVHWEFFDSLSELRSSKSPSRQRRLLPLTEEEAGRDKVVTSLTFETKSDLVILLPILVQTHAWVYAI